MSRLVQPESAQALVEMLKASDTQREPAGMIARGYGRSYGDQCLNHGGTIVSTINLTKIHSFDATSGVMQCDAGISFAQVMRHCVPLGWIPAVCPGTAIVSMGGAIANDVHGKNQRHAGTFADPRRLV